MNLLCAFARDPDYFAVGSPRSRVRIRGLWLSRGDLGGGNRGPCRGPENWFRTECASGFRERPHIREGRRAATRRDASHPSRTPGALKRALKEAPPNRRIGRPVGRSVARSSNRASLDGLGVSFHVGLQPACHFFSSFFLSPGPPLPPLRLLRLPLAFSLPRARGPWEWPWKFNSPPSNGAALSRVLLLVPRYPSSHPPPFLLLRPCVPSSLCVARWNLTSLRSTVASMHRLAVLFYCGLATTRRRFPEWKKLVLSIRIKTYRFC